MDLHATIFQFVSLTFTVLLYCNKTTLPRDITTIQCLAQATSAVSPFRLNSRKLVFNSSCPLPPTSAVETLQSLPTLQFLFQISLKHVNRSLVTLCEMKIQSMERIFRHGNEIKRIYWNETLLNPSLTKDLDILAFHNNKKTEMWVEIKFFTLFLLWLGVQMKTKHISNLMWICNVNMQYRIKLRKC
jgi:hypothetical protein